MAAQTWNIDPTHSNVGFTVRHLVITKVRGRFSKFSGTLTYDIAAPESAKVEATIDVGSIDTAEAKRDEHLKSADFFDAAKFPEMKFTSTSVKKDGGDLKVSGDFTLHGVTKPITLTVEALGTGKDPWGGERAGFSAKGSIDRKDFGLTWNQALEAGGLVVGEKVELELEVQAVKQA